MDGNWAVHEGVLGMKTLDEKDALKNMAIHIPIKAPMIELVAVTLSVLRIGFFMVNP
ncbi:hypothetical protein [Alloscardovia theropitheci]|uniref:hypothetical protein n=1 Tax=Alloscardovia theropitheci TaxID=2496842 RepID=UPI001F0E7BF0|nr:hypothetical protein [Alloscardovia theropitheci]